MNSIFGLCRRTLFKGAIAVAMLSATTSIAAVRDRHDPLRDTVDRIDRSISPRSGREERELV